MATSTTNLGLIKPAGTDKIRIAQINSNMDVIDTKMGAVGNTPLQTQINTSNSNINKLQANSVIPSNVNVQDYCDSLDIGFFRAFLGASSTALDQGGPVANAAMLLISKNAADHIQVIAMPFDQTKYPLYLLRKYGGYWGTEWMELTNNKTMEYHVGDTYEFADEQIPFRSLNDLSAVYFIYPLPKKCGSDVTSFTLSVTRNSPTWYTGTGLGNISTNTTVDNVSIRDKKCLCFSLTPDNAIQESGFGLCSLGARVTFV